MTEVKGRYFKLASGHLRANLWGPPGASEGGGAERPMSGQAKPDGEEGVKSGAGQRARRQADAPEAAELRAADPR